MEPKHWLFIALGLLVVFRIIKGILNPPKPITWADVPEHLRAVFETSLPAFEIKGRSQDWRWEIEITAAGQLIELEKSVLRG